MSIGLPLDHARPAEYRDASGARGPQRGDAGIGGGAAGVDIVHDHDVAAAHCLTTIRGNDEGAAHRPSAAGRPQPP